MIFIPFKKKNTFCYDRSCHLSKYRSEVNTVTHSKKMIKYIRNQIGFKNILISDDLSMKSLKNDIKNNTIKHLKQDAILLFIVMVI